MQSGKRYWSTPQLRRILEHSIFWLGALCVLTFYYGAGKASYLVPLRNNLFYLPVHMLYFYMLAYVLMPRYLYTRRYLYFSLTLLTLVLIIGVIIRFVDMNFVDPYLYALQKEIQPDFYWDKMEGTVLERLSNLYYFTNALKGVNLIVWGALCIKFFKMWYERKNAARDAELNLLKNQIHPHFLFNTLNNLYSLTIQKSPQAPSVVMGLSEILRFMLYEGNTSQVSLKRDIEIVESFIALEKIRYEERLDLSFSVTGDTAGKEIAPLLILPLVENAFKHGVSEQLDEAWINIDIAVKGDTLKVKISNSKPEAVTGGNGKHKGEIGLQNIRKRLEMLYPQASELKLFDEDDMFIAILEIQLDKFFNLAP